VGGMFGGLLGGIRTLGFWFLYMLIGDKANNASGTSLTFMGVLPASVFISVPFCAPLIIAGKAQSGNGIALAILFITIAVFFLSIFLDVLDDSLKSKGK
jgi:hypothetical protein